MLCGLTGSGKSTYADVLARRGFVKLSLDESMYEKHGRVGANFDAKWYAEFEAVVKRELEQQLVSLIAKGESVVLDYGFWTRLDRDYHKKLIEDSGASWRLVYFRVEPETLRERLATRNNRTDANAVFVTAGMLAKFIGSFQEPVGEGEESPW